MAQQADAKLSSNASRTEKVKAFIIKNYLPIAFLVALGLALAWPVPGRFLADLAILGNVRIVQVAAMALVFLITGLQLNTAELRRALQPRNALLLAYGFVAILVITPCLGFALRAAPLEPKAFATGLAIFCVAPTTLGVGVALTTACGGNEAMALLLTVGTNALAVATMPPELRLLIPARDAAAGGGGGGGEGYNVDVKVTDLLIKLAITVLVPSAIGKAARELSPSTLAFVKAHRLQLSLLSTSALAFVVWQTLSAARDTLLKQRAGPVFAMIGLAVAMHVAYLVGNYVIVWWVLRAPLREAIAVVIMASQKSAPVAVTCITFLTRDAAQQGLLSLPAIVGQLCQIFIGAGLAKWLARVVARDEGAKKEAAASEAAAQVEAVEEGRAGIDTDTDAGALGRAPQPAAEAEEPAAGCKPLGNGALPTAVDLDAAGQPGPSMGVGKGGWDSFQRRELCAGASGTGAERAAAAAVDTLPRVPGAGVEALTGSAGRGHALAAGSLVGVVRPHGEEQTG